VKAPGTSSRGSTSDGYGPYGTRPISGRRPSRRHRRLLRVVKVLFALIVLAAIAFGGLYLVTPSVSDAPLLVREQAAQHNISYPGVQPPARFTEALVATEDHRFYSTPGIDPFAVARLIAGKFTGHPDQGGSTLEQQLAKNLYSRGRSGFAAKAEQVMLAFKLAMSYSKPRILQMYAEIAYYGDNYYGLQAASCGYFGTQPSQLTWPQAALLAGIVNAPTADDPRTNPANARAREVHVVGRLVAVGDLTQAQGSAVLAQSLELVPQGTGCAG
jgi:membrane peptidoglycan carboxypeptidase